MRWEEVQRQHNWPLSKSGGSAELLQYRHGGRFCIERAARILLSGSTAVDSIDPTAFLRLPVEPSRGNYYEAGLTHAFAGRLRLDASYFRRDVTTMRTTTRSTTRRSAFPSPSGNRSSMARKANSTFPSGTVSRVS